jgi:hypothetical protein
VAEEGLRRGSIRERRENAPSESDRETTDSVVRGRERALEGVRCLWLVKDAVEGDGRERERLDWVDWENSEVGLV